MSKPTDDDAEWVWNKAGKVRGKDPNLYRRDVFGNVIYKPSYGKDSDMGWEVDHKKPLAKGGTDHRRNLQALQTKANKEKGDKYP